MGGTYAILGATGNCGSALLELLLKVPDNTIHAYCRNKPKLMRMMPAAAESKRIQIFEGNISDVDLMVACIRGCKAVFLVASTNTNVPGYRVGQDTAEVIITALRKIKAADAAAQLPKIVVLSSASIDEHLDRNTPRWLHFFLDLSARFVYDDLRIQEKILRNEEDWVTTIFIKPGGLSNDKQRGHQLNLDHQETFVSYLDLSAGMIEAADDPDARYDMKNVSVVNTGGSAKVPRGTPACIFLGIVRFYFPRLHPYLPTPGP